MFYSGNMPWNDPQGVFSQFWWNIAAKVPAYFEFVPYHADTLKDVFRVQQQEINKAAGKSKGTLKSERADEEQNWQSYPFLKKLKYYYNHNGMKQTIRYGIQKLTGGNR